MKTHEAVILLRNYRIAAVTLSEWSILAGNARLPGPDGVSMSAYEDATRDIYAQALRNEEALRHELIALLEKTNA